MRRIIIIYHWWIMLSLIRHCVQIPITCKLLKQQWALVRLTNCIQGRVGVIIMRRLMKRPLSQRLRGVTFPWIFETMPPTKGTIKINTNGLDTRFSSTYQAISVIVATLFLTCTWYLLWIVIYRNLYSYKYCF